MIHADYVVRELLRGERFVEIHREVFARIDNIQVVSRGRGFRLLFRLGEDVVSSVDTAADLGNGDSVEFWFSAGAFIPVDVAAK